MQNILGTLDEQACGTAGRSSLKLEAARPFSIGLAGLAAGRGELTIRHRPDTFDTSALTDEQSR